MPQLSRMRCVSFAAALLVAVLLPACAQQSSAVLGPYVQNVGKDNATICWATVSGQVNYDPASADQQTAARAYDHHSIVLRELQPDTTYTYDVLGDGSSAGKGTFTTFPAGEKPFNFIVFGDTRSPSPMHQVVVERIMTEKPEMVFNTGDLVTNGWSMWQWEHFFTVSGPLMRSVPYYPCLGNHEQDAQLYFDFFSLPGNERYYSFDRGAAHFVVLDSVGPRIPPTNQASNPQDTARFAERVKQYWEQQIAWLKDDLAAYQNVKYVFVFFHHPLYSIMKNRQQNAKEMREHFGTIFQDYKVTAVFTGHDHHYHRALAGGIPFVTTGGGGANTYETDAIQPETVKYARVHHFVRVEVGPERAVARATDVDGNTIDEFELPARAAVGSR